MIVLMIAMNRNHRSLVICQQMINQLWLTTMIDRLQALVTDWPLRPNKMANRLQFATTITQLRLIVSTPAYFCYVQATEETK